ncbi:uncharacterized protein LOC131217045 isoform X5 [Magnolia sinica]|uniref:uncharacterized protein LOC131217045 isoform X5 n=1 Tax=Magnolia sinica TaxID=86752 RepID=UPI00265ACEAE|nr:uncharacterized protein LOC131217045 isoform X5 [Magnolia sinica]
MHYLPSFQIGALEKIGLTKFFFSFFFIYLFYFIFYFYYCDCLTVLKADKYQHQSLLQLIVNCILHKMVENDAIVVLTLRKDDNEFEDVNIVRPDDLYHSRDADASLSW